jgi:hypothetical protein
MDITTINTLLSSHCTHQSQWEFTNFFLEQQGEFPGRRAQSVLTRRKQLAQQLAQQVSPLDHQNLLNEAVQLDQWLNERGPEQLTQDLASLEADEAEYWPQRLGREAAVDLLSRGRVSKEVMTRAVLLSEEGYAKFAETCGSITHVITAASREVEQSQGYVTMPEGMPR